jgi:hypothetical protein
LYTYSNTSTPSLTNYSLFNFYSDLDRLNPGTIVYDKNNTDSLFKIDKNNNTIQIGTFTAGLGAIEIGGNIMTVRAKSDITIFQGANESMRLLLQKTGMSFENNNDNNNKDFKNIFLPYNLNLTITSETKSVVEAEVEVTKKYEKSLLFTNNFPESDSEKKIIIPYGTDLTDYNKTTFRQSIIDHTTVINPYGDLYNKITSNQKYPTTIKTTVNENILPRMTNTTVIYYYSSYINTVLPQTTSTTSKTLVQYFCTDEKYPAIKFAVCNSTEISPRLSLMVYDKTGNRKMDYIVTHDQPKYVLDLTYYVNTIRPGEEIVSAQFMLSEWGGSADDFYQHCINILSNVFISYTYKD